MTQLLAARQLILEALEAAGISSATTQRFSAPCVHVEPGDPWTEPARLPGRTSRWRLTALAGRTDSEGAYLALAELIDQTDTALRSIPGCQLPSWSKPADYVIGEQTHAGSVATVTLATS